MKEAKGTKHLSLQILKSIGVPTEPNVLERIVNETVRYDAMDDVDTITTEESDNRIVICEVFISLALIFISTILTVVAYYIKKSTIPILFVPHITKADTQGYPVPHLALIYNDGRVVDMSLNESISPSRNDLLQLPKDEAYFGFSDQFGSLNLISSSLTRSITEVHPDTGHQIVPNSIAVKKDEIEYINEMHGFTQGVQFGNKFWVWGNTNSGNQLVNKVFTFFDKISNWSLLHRFIWMAHL